MIEGEYKIFLLLVGLCFDDITYPKPGYTFMTKPLLSSILRQDFASFIGKVFATINPGIEYEHNWHIDLIADYLILVEKGDIKRLIINIPPRALKSVCVSVAWPSSL